MTSSQLKRGVRGATLPPLPADAAAKRKGKTGWRLRRSMAIAADSSGHTERAAHLTGSDRRSLPDLFRWEKAHTRSGDATIPAPAPHNAEEFSRFRALSLKEIPNRRRAKIPRSTLHG